MTKKLGFIVKKTMLSRMAKYLFMNVFAEEPVVVDPTKVDPTKVDPAKNTNTDPIKKDVPVVNFEDMVSRARKEEKAKLYPQIEGLKKEIKELTEKSNANLLTIEGKSAEIEKLEAKLVEAESGSSKSDSEAVTSLKKEVKDFKKTIADMKANTVDVEALETRIKGEYDVKLYRAEKIGSDSEIIEELVTGLTREEIDASFDIAKARYTKIKEGMGGSNNNNMQNIPVNNVGATKLNTKDFKVEDLARLDVRSPEYKTLRAQLGFK